MLWKLKKLLPEVDRFSLTHQGDEKIGLQIRTFLEGIIESLMYRNFDSPYRWDFKNELACIECGLHRLFLIKYKLKERAVRCGS